MKKAETAYREQEDRLNSELISWKHRSGNAETRGKQVRLLYFMTKCFR